MTETTPETVARPPRYWLRLVVFAVIALIVALFSMPFAFGAVGMWALTHPPCGDNGAKPDKSYQEIVIPSTSGKSFRGFFIPGTKDALIIVPPAYSGGRNGMLPEAMLLVEDGFNVLTFESRACAGYGSMSLGYQEVEDVKNVITYVQQNPDKLPVDGERIALHGFSSAGATSTMATARYPEIDAVLAEGGYHNINDLMGYDTSNTFHQLMVLGARTVYWFTTGHDTSVLDPVGVIGQIPPRPVLLVYGTEEVSLQGAREQLAVLRGIAPDSFAELWEVPGATHGGYLGAVGVEDYKRHVLAFYNCALLQQCEQWETLLQ